jgi:ABC-2 type transport system permease protein
MTRFSWRRTYAVFLKEFQQMLRDRLTFAMAIGVPVLQLVLFGYAINTDPRGLPTALVSADTSPMARSVAASLQNTGYFRIVHQGTSEAEAEDLLARGEVQFLLVIPPRFGERLVRGEKPQLLLAVDATDPVPPPARRCSAISPVPCTACRRRRCRSTSWCTSATTPRGSRATTSCRGW